MKEEEIKKKITFLGRKMSKYQFIIQDAEYNLNNYKHQLIELQKKLDNLIKI